MNRVPRDRRSDEGIAVIWVAVFLLVSLWFVSLAIDMGKLMAAKTELQATADAAALAGAASVDLETGAIIQDSAKTHAEEIAFENRAYEGLQTPVVVPSDDISFPLPNRVRVIARRQADTGNPVLTHFAQTLGIPNLSVNADATAEVHKIGEPCEHLAPFAPQDVPSGVFVSDCAIDYTLTVGSGASSSGNFQLLDYPPCDEGNPPFVGGGAAAIYHYTRYGYSCCITIGDEWVWTKPGLSAGPFEKALKERFDADSDVNNGICYEDYKGNGSRIFITPIIESFDVSGKKMVRITKFAAFFMKYRPTNLVKDGLTGQFVKYVVPGNAGPNPPDDSMIYGIHLVE